MGIKVGINGFGRIGRNVMRTALGDADIDFVAVNDLTDTKTLAHLLKYDSVMGNLEQDISAAENSINVDGDEFRVKALKFKFRASVNFLMSDAQQHFYCSSAKTL